MKCYKRGKEFEENFCVRCRNKGKAKMLRHVINAGICVLTGITLVGALGWQEEYKMIVDVQAADQEESVEFEKEWYKKYTHFQAPDTGDVVDMEFLDGGYVQ